MDLPLLDQFAAPAAPNASIRGDEQSCAMDVLDRLLGIYSDRVHEMPDEQKYATGAMPMAPNPVSFVLKIQAGGY